MEKKKIANVAAQVFLSSVFVILVIGTVVCTKKLTETSNNVFIWERIAVSSLMALSVGLILWRRLVGLVALYATTFIHVIAKSLMLGMGILDFSLRLKWLWGLVAVISFAACLIENKKDKSLLERIRGTTINTVVGDVWTVIKDWALWIGVIILYLGVDGRLYNIPTFLVVIILLSIDYIYKLRTMPSLIKKETIGWRIVEVVLWGIAVPILIMIAAIILLDMLHVGFAHEVAALLVEWSLCYFS